MWRLLIEGLLFVLVAGTAVVAVTSLIKETVVAWWNGQKAFPHSRDPIVMMQDASEQRLALANASYAAALKEAEARKKEALANKQNERNWSGAIEDEITRANNAKAQELEELAARLRSGEVNVDVDPIPDLGEGQEKERGSTKNRVR